MVIFCTFIGCENDIVWNLSRPNPNDLYNVCFEYNCDSLNEIAIGNWELASTYSARKGDAFRSSREPGEYIKILYSSTTNSKLSFWISDWDLGGDTTLLTNGEILKVYVNNVQYPVHVVKKERSFITYFCKVSTDVFQVASPSTIRIEIQGIADAYTRQFASKPVIDEIEIKCH